MSQKDQKFGSYCFEELETAKVLEKDSTEVVELKPESREDLEYSQKSRKLIEQEGVVRNYRNKVQENQPQATSSKFREHSQNLQVEAEVGTFGVQIRGKTDEKQTFLRGSEFEEYSQDSWKDPCIKITEHEGLKEVRLPLKPKQLQQLQKNDTYWRDMAKKLHKDVEMQKIFIKEIGVLYRLWTEDGRTFKCILVPQVLQDFMVILAHDYSGHNGSRRTYNCLKKQYYQPGMRKQIFRHCKKCTECKTKDGQKKDLVTLIHQNC